jgi:hypothetical protein
MYVGPASVWGTTAHWGTGFWVWGGTEWLQYPGAWWVTPQYPGWVWMGQPWVWDGTKWLSQDGYWTTVDALEGLPDARVIAAPSSAPPVGEPAEE